MSGKYVMIPKFDELRIQALRVLDEGGVLRVKDFLVPLAEYFGLTDDELNAMYPSGKGPIFYDRISWALSYLYLAGLIDKPQRGAYRINALGRNMLAEKTPDQINAYVEKTVQSRSPMQKSKKAEKAGVSLSLQMPVSSGLTPQESLYDSFDNIRKSVFAEILNTIISKEAREFERLVVKLLQTMGYGGEIKDAGYVTKATNDGGIDGVIKEDILGFGKIYIQAKRYALNNAVSREEVQKFVGALAVAQSSKGVFITTSYFSSGAVNFVNNLNGSPTVVLMDGRKLAEYIYDFGLGMQLEQTIEIKKLDTDFWDSMEDDHKTTAK